MAAASGPSTERVNRLGRLQKRSVLKIANNPIKGFEPARWNQMLDEAGYPKTKIPGDRKLEAKSGVLPK